MLWRDVMRNVSGVRGSILDTCWTPEAMGGLSH
jgi:hypothetical protein